MRTTTVPSFAALADQTVNTRLTKIMRRGRATVTLLLAILGASLAMVVIPVPALAAVSCNGDYCSGQDPRDTGCADDGVTVAYRDFAQGNTSGRLELRWSGRCQTNWSRVTVYQVPWYNWATTGTVSAVQRDTGYTQRAEVPRADNTVQVWTPMIYSPVRQVQARYHTETNPCRSWVTNCQWSPLDVATDWV